MCVCFFEKSSFDRADAKVILPPCGSKYINSTEKCSKIRQVGFNILDFGGADFLTSGKFR